jgi:organic hydroperoxide reductase OsmC/OhrA
MADHRATIVWKDSGEGFSKNRYSRGHLWQFDGGVEVRASASPHNVPLPWSVAEAVDPEEAFVASLSSCHMLWFLYIAAKRGWEIQSYRDEAIGTMQKNAEGKLALTRIVMRPFAEFTGRQPSVEDLRAMHHEAHEECFLANSVKTEIHCEPTSAVA